MKKRKSSFAKYYDIIISVVLLLLLLVGILGFNFYMSAKIGKETIAINLSGRQGILTQELAKHVLNIDLLTEGSEGKVDLPEVRIATTELEKTRDLFDKTLEAFEQGKSTTDAQGQTIVLDKVINPEGIKSLQAGKAIWLPYRRLIDSFVLSVDSGSTNKGAINFASDYTRLFNDRLFNEMNDLNGALAEDSNRQTSLVQLVQTVGFVLALLLFFYIIFGALRRLFRTDKELEKARQETTNIMKTVKEGLFLLDKSLVVGNEYSGELERVLGKKKLAGRSLNNLVQDIVSIKDFEATEDFIEQLFNPKVVEDLVHDLNPLDRVMASVNNDAGVAETRYLSFGFSRVYEQETITHVLVSIADITQEVLLECRLEKERLQNEEQLEMLASILHVDSAMMEEFMNHVEQVCERTNDELRRPKQSKMALINKLSAIYREVHSIKGEASALELKGFVSQIDEMETQVAKLKSKADLTGNDFLTLTVHLEKLIEMSNKVRELQQKLGGMITNKTTVAVDSVQRVSTGTEASSEATGEGPLDTNSVLPETLLTQFVKQAAERNQKKVNLVTEGLETLNLPKDKQLMVKDIVIQLLRNAVVHGIELPEKRVAMGKTEQGGVLVRVLQKADNNVDLTLEDDGAGIDFYRLKIEAEAQGYFRKQSIPPTKVQLLKFMFKSGVSTLSDSHEDGGRGVGMDVIRHRIQSLGGKIRIDSEKGKFTRFIIRFPI